MVEVHTEQPVGSGATPSHKTRWIVVAAVVLVIVASAVVWWLMQKKSADENPANSGVHIAASKICSDELIGEANAPLANSDQVALGAVVDKVTALKNFDHDPNCLYIALQYSLASGNATQSSDYYNKLSRVYDSVTGYSRVFTVNLAPLSSLKQSVDFIVQNSKDTEAAAKQGDESTAAGSDAADKFQQEHKK
jgi:flagellar basal body-associated protein FliL